jgi:hypothetical protein
MKPAQFSGACEFCHFANSNCDGKRVSSCAGTGSNRFAALALPSWSNFRRCPRFISSISGEFRRYKALGDAALAQLKDEELASGNAAAGSNSAAVLVWHVGGNLRSRFTDFLTTDGEKAWRKRDEEFTAHAVTREELLAKWSGGWMRCSARSMH